MTMRSIYSALRVTVFLSVLIIMPHHAAHADGDLDTGFSLGTQGGVNSQVYTSLVQSDGKIALGGEFTSHNGITTKGRFTRVNADGTMDQSFNSGGSGANSSVFSAAQQSDGKIIIGGNFTTYNGISRVRTARLNTDGTLDTTFISGTGASDVVFTLATQPDGKIIIGGRFTTYDGVTVNRIARLNTDGSLDTTFNSGTGFNTSDIRAIVIQSDGKILIGGGFTSYNGTSRNRIIRLNADGTVDGTFGTGTGANNSVLTISLQPDGKIVIGGTFSSVNGTSRNRIARLNDNGSLDTTFDPGTGCDSNVYSSFLQPDGKIVIGGNFTIFNGTSASFLVRLNTDGTLDTTFETNIAANDYVYIASLLSTGKILIGGNFTEYDNTSRSYAAQVNTDGSLDAAFNMGVGTSGFIIPTVVQPDGKIITGGDFVSIGGVSKRRIARINADGTLDTTFDPGTGANSVVRAIALQPDGKIVIGGSFTTYNGVSRNRIARLNTDGTLDTTFNPGTGANDVVYAIAVQSDGKILVGGTFYLYNGTSKSSIMRLNTDGSLDTTYVYTSPGGAVRSITVQSDGKAVTAASVSTGGYVRRFNTDGTSDTSFTEGVLGAGFSVNATALQPDGKILVGGSFTAYNGTPINRIARLNTDGTLDTTFTVGTGANSTVQTISLQPDGKIVIGGSFSAYTGVSRNRIARLNTDGTLDTTFTPGTGADGNVSSAALQSDNKIVIGGYFSLVNLQSRNRIARLNSDGTVDTGFNVSAGSSDIIYTTAIQNDGNAIIGGNFTTISGTSRNYIARVYASGALDISFNPGTGANGIVRSIALQSNGRAVISGDFTNYNGVASNRVTRVNNDGSLDTAYTANTGTAANDIVRAVMLQSDERAIIVGDFTSFNGTSRNRIARIGTGGILDNSFIPGTGANNNIHTVTILSDDSILIGGDFTTYNGDTHNRMAKLNADGTLVTSFTPDINGIVRSIKTQSDGKILIAGDFTTVNGTARNRIARLNADGTLDTSFDPGTGMNGTINTLTIQNNDKIIAAGDFTTVNGISINRITRLNTDGTRDTVFNPGTGTNNVIYTTNLYTPSTLFIGGSFITYNATSAPILARILLVVNPSVTTQAATNITTTTLTLNANLTDDGGEDAQRYIDYGTATGNYTSSCSAGSAAEGTYSCNLTSLTPYTMYYFRARTTNSTATAYGTELTVRTRANLATVTTLQATSIITSAATARANTTDTGGNDPQRYIEYGTASGTYTLTCDAGTGPTGIYECALTNLTPNTTYYYRAKTVNDGGTSYGGEVSFTTGQQTQKTHIESSGTIKLPNNVRFGG